MGVGTRRAAPSGLQRSANMEEALENTNVAMKAQQETAQKNPCSIWMQIITCSL